MSDSQKKDVPSFWEKIGVLPDSKFEDLFGNRTDVEEFIDVCAKDSNSLAEEFIEKTTTLSPEETVLFLRRLDDLLDEKDKLNMFNSLLRSQIPTADALNIVSNFHKRDHAATEPFRHLLNEVDHWPLDHLQMLQSSGRMEEYQPFFDMKVSNWSPPLETYDVPYLDALSEASKANDRIYHSVISKIRFGSGAITEEGGERTAALNRLYSEYKDICAALLQYRYATIRMGTKWPKEASPLEQYCSINGLKTTEMAGILSAVDGFFEKIPGVYWPFVSQLDDGRKSVSGQSDVSSADSEQIIPWQTAQENIIGAFASISPSMGEFVRTMFAKNKVDLVPRNGRQNSGGKQISGSRKHLPIIFASYYGNIESISVIAHEMGHAIRSQLACKQPCLLKRIPYPFSEVFSLFSEALMFSYLMEISKTDAEKNAIEKEAICQQMHNVFNLAAQSRFEESLYEQSGISILTADYIADAFDVVKNRICKPGLTSIKHDWIGQTPLFERPMYHTASYVYAQLVANALWRDYKKRGDDFVRDYIDIMEAGSTKPPCELLKPFGVSTEDPNFWTKELKCLEAYINAHMDKLCGPTRKDQVCDNYAKYAKLKVK